MEIMAALEIGGFFDVSRESLDRFNNQQTTKTADYNPDYGTKKIQELIEGQVISYIGAKISFWLDFNLALMKCFCLTLVELHWLQLECVGQPGDVSMLK